MGSRVSRVPVGGRGIPRSSQIKKMVLNVDLNVPAIESHDEGTSVCPSRQAAVPDARSVPPPLVPIDVDLIDDDDDDDVLISSPRAFAEAKDQSRRTRSRRIVDLDAEDSSSHANNHNKRRRIPEYQPVIVCQEYVILDCEYDNPRGLRGANGTSNEQIVQPPPPPKEPTFNCPVCMGPLVEETSTKCGHIFCKGCIRTAIAVQKKCPTCRKKTTMKDIMRVYLPSAS